MVGASKFSSNHRACAECKILTLDLTLLWKKFILWEGISKCKNGIVKQVLLRNKWETVLGKELRIGILEYGIKCGKFKRI